MIKREILNQIINFFWSILCIAPVFWFWFQMGINNLYFYLFMTISLIIGVLPQRILNSLAFSSKIKFYERFGVKYIKKFVQNGDIVNSLNSPNDIIKGKKYFMSYAKTIEMYERYHLICLIFFLLTTLHCIVSEQIKLSLIIIITNIFYNICPILLQQYNKLRLKKLFNN